MDSRVLRLLLIHLVLLASTVPAAFLPLASQFWGGAVLSAQICLLVAWLALAPAGVLLRLAALAVIGVTHAASYAMLLSQNPSLSWSVRAQILVFSLFSGALRSVVCATALWFLMRFTGYHLVRREESAQPAESNWQFSIGHLLLLTTVVSVVAAVGSYARRAFGPNLSEVIRNPGVAVLYTAFSIVTALGHLLAVTLVALWATLTDQSTYHRLVVACLTGIFVAMVVPYYFGYPLVMYVAFAGSALGTMIILLSTLRAVARMGYRIERRSAHDEDGLNLEPAFGSGITPTDGTSPSPTVSYDPLEHGPGGR